MIHQYYSGGHHHPVQPQPEQSQHVPRPVIHDTTILNELKSAISNVTECVLGIADVIAGKQIDPLTEKEADKNEEQSTNETDETGPSKTTIEAEIHVIPEESVSHESEESSSSMDEMVPEITEEPLNC